MEPISFLQPATPTAEIGQVSRQIGIADNFDTFLTLLTSQIQNQDPLSPVESNEFTNQLVQFSQVEQQIQTNTQIESLLRVNRAATGASLSGYLGQQAEILSDAAGYSGADVEWSYRLPEGVSSAQLSIADASGRVVFTRAVAPSEGRSEFVWDGQTTDGVTAPHGAYRLSVTGTTNQDKTVGATVRVVAAITGVDFSNPDPAVTTAVGIYAYSDIVRITAS